jgi:transcriptional regulator
MNELSDLHDVIRAAQLASFVTATADGLIAAPLPLFLIPEEGAYGTLYGHQARPNPQWRSIPVGGALAIFMGPDAYVSPSWYPAKQEHGKVVPTWNYVAVHAYGQVEFFDDPDRLLDVVTRLTNLHEGRKPVGRHGRTRGFHPHHAARNRRIAHPDRSLGGQAKDEPEPDR